MYEVDKLQKKSETAILVSLSLTSEDRDRSDEYLDELEFLSNTLGLKTEARFKQHLQTPDKRTFVGKGKLEEIHEFIKIHEIQVVVFDDDLSPSQLRNIEDELSIKIYDRSLLILDIFLFRAKTAQAKTQVELARAEYLLPRLTRMWTHLERQRGGTGTRGGAGEKEIETDRRDVRTKITRLKKKLEKIDKQSATQRKGRDGMVRVALVGYTNVGKSSLMRLLSKENVFAENKLFATVDSTVRKVVLHDIPFLLTDTVGFIRKLPTTLIECFKSTLDEVREADMLIHVVDVSNDSFEDHKAVVNQTLVDIGAADKPTLELYNKIDLLDVEEREGLAKSYLKKDNSAFVSVTDQTNIDELKNVIFGQVAEQHFSIYPNYKSHYYDYYKEFLLKENLSDNKGEES